MEVPRGGIFVTTDAAEVMGRFYTLRPHMPTRCTQILTLPDMERPEGWRVKDPVLIYASCWWTPSGESDGRAQRIEVDAFLAAHATGAAHVNVHGVVTATNIGGPTMQRQAAAVLMARLWPKLCTHADLLCAAEPMFIQSFGYSMAAMSGADLPRPERFHAKVDAAKDRDP